MKKELSSFEQRREKWLNPTVIVHSENAYHLVGSLHYAAHAIKYRFKIHKDKKGRFVVIRKRIRVYEDKWIYN